MLPFETEGMTDASTTRRPSTPWTRIDDGSTTASGPVPILQVQDGWSAVSASEATQAWSAESQAALTEPLAVVCKAVLERAKVEAQDTVVVLGCGPIGLLAAAAAKAV